MKTFNLLFITLTIIALNSNAQQNTVIQKGSLYTIKSNSGNDIFSPFDIGAETCDDDLLSAQINTVVKYERAIDDNKSLIIVIKASVRFNNTEEEIEFGKYYCIKTKTLLRYFQSSLEPKNYTDLIFYRVDQMLSSEGVLHENERALRPKERKTEQRIRAKIKQKYQTPSGLSTQDYSTAVRGINPSYFGSSIFDNSYAEPKSTLPTISILSDYKQITVRAPQSDNFKMFYSLTDVMNLSLDMDLSGGVADILVAKVKTAASQQEQNKRSISLIAGVFENELSKVYDRIETGAITDIDWTPAFDLWQFYFLNQIPSTNTKKIIRNFEGLIVSDKRNSEFSSKVEVISNLSGNYRAIPFFKFEGEANVDWRKETSSNSSFSQYDIYLRKDPVLRLIPTPNKIKEAWFKKAKLLQTSHELKITPQDETNKVTLAFGPVTPDQINDLTISLTELENSIPGLQKIIKSGVQLGNINIVNNVAYIPIHFEYNTPFFTTARTKIDIELKLNVSLGNPVHGLKLEKVYTIFLSAQGSLIPALAPDGPLFPAAVVTEGTSLHTWSFDIIFKNSNVPNSIDDILRGDIQVDDPRLKFIFNAPNLKVASCTQKSTQGRYTVNIKSDIPSDRITFSDNNITASLTLKPIKNNIEAPRTLSVVLTGVKTPEILASSTILLPDIGLLIKSLNGEYKTNSGETINEIREKMNEKELMNFVNKQLIDELKIIYKPSQGYFIKPEFLNIDLIKRN